jgi:hypothetical protein
MAPPKKYTNITISITGRNSAVISPSTLRRDSLSARTIIVASSLSPEAARSRSPSPASRSTARG